MLGHIERHRERIIKVDPLRVAMRQRLRQLLLVAIVAATSTTTHADDFKDLMSKFGGPDFIDSTENDRPRPFIVLKWVKYDRANVKAVFVPEGPAGAPPPYRGWTLVGYVDMATDTKLDPAVAEARLHRARRK